jgi:hypothetical protein
VAKRDLHQQSLYLEPEKAEILDQLAAETRIPKAVLLREAVDDLLVKFKKMKPLRRPANK